MKNYRGTRKGFYVLHGDPGGRIRDQIAIGFYASDGSTVGEFEIAWVQIGNYYSPRLAAFHDAWDSLSHFQDVIRALAQLDGQRPDIEQVAKVLRECGIQDRTERGSAQTVSGDSE